MMRALLVLHFLFATFFRTEAAREVYQSSDFPASCSLEAPLHSSFAISKSCQEARTTRLTLTHSKQRRCQAKTGRQWGTRLRVAHRRRLGYTLGMKTAVSIPNELFDVAERLARRTRKSRSRLFSDALREYVARRSPDKITEAMDEALAEIGANGNEESNDPFLAAASRRRLEQSEW